MRAALDDAPLESPLAGWIEHIRRIRRAHQRELDALGGEDARWRRLCELNVAAQVANTAATPLVRRAWERGQPLALHGWIYDLHDGLLRDLEWYVTGPADVPGPGTR